MARPPDPPESYLRLRRGPCRNIDCRLSKNHPGHCVAPEEAVQLDAEGRTQEVAHEMVMSAFRKTGWRVSNARDAQLLLRGYEAGVVAERAQVLAIIHENSHERHRGEGDCLCRMCNLYRALRIYTTDEIKDVRVVRTEGEPPYMTVHMSDGTTATIELGELTDVADEQREVDDG